MKWNVYTVTTTVDAEDYVSAALIGLGYEGVEIIDDVPLSPEDVKAMFIDLVPDHDPNDNTSKVRCYTEIPEGGCADSPEERERRIAEIREEIESYRDIVDLGELKIEASETEDIDWINNWKKYFHAFRIGDDIVIHPSWEAPSETREGDLVVEIDPGTAFGTGSHETTWLCIEALRRCVKPGDAVLDVGCGSGILSIVAKLIGASYCVGIDIDPIAVKVSQENALKNNLTLITPEEPVIEPGTVSYFAYDVISDAEAAAKVRQDRYPVVVANILTDVIIPLMPVVKGFLLPDGVFITSGILATREQEVREAFTRNGYQVVDVRKRNDWLSVTAKLAD